MCVSISIGRCPCVSVLILVVAPVTTEQCILTIVSQNAVRYTQCIAIGCILATRQHFGTSLSYLFRRLSAALWLTSFAYLRAHPLSTRCYHSIQYTSEPESNSFSGEGHTTSLISMHDVRPIMYSLPGRSLIAYVEGPIIPIYP